MRIPKTSVDTLKNAASLFMKADDVTPIRVHVYVDLSAEDFIINTVKALFIPVDPQAQLCIFSVCSVVDSPAHVHPAADCDACIVLCGHNSSAIIRVVDEYLAAQVPCAMIARSSIEMPVLSFEHDESLVGLIAASDASTLEQKLALWTANSLAEKGIAFARAFSFARRAKVNQLVRTCALQNAAVGAINFIPGADMPVMTTNQMRLALDIAQVYGREQDLSRMGDIAAVVGAGMVYRGAARALLGAIPVAGIVAKAGVGFGGTVSTGRALAARFELEDRMQKNMDV
ncbi:DUF697 domain-containing protein [Atopobium fossor]|uniref:DUF697 domain-containing protein n=1 Tax=Atopobium fossor TaxID=39487 RepID=UPI00041FB9A7|nr:DUF697 domain-containing protein [Atopobium fossor]